MFGASMEPGGVSNASEHRKILLQDFESLLTYVLSYLDLFTPLISTFHTWPYSTEHCAASVRAHLPTPVSAVNARGQRHQLCSFLLWGMFLWCKPLSILPKSIPLCLGKALFQFLRLRIVTRKVTEQVAKMEKEICAVTPSIKRT